ncbi:MAG: tRNA lysidine(34) synthetase TilS [Helicobacteraceae bacterium]|nr:tRNA lysidine(34) synthetase TilS [Helicobacteraceae bacterium]
MLESKLLKPLQGRKNLLAFSGGADSTALFFLLLEHHIDFDIAIVDYQIRTQSKEELKYAQTLAQTHQLICHHTKAPKIEKNFESEARSFRYHFFEELITKYSYKNLITAHHLGDRFEWMLMQFCKGAGCVELTGIQREQKRDGYTLIRPLLHLDKQELLHYLEANKLHYFEDESNLDESIKRNEFRHNYALPLLEKYLSGIKKSFDYLDADAQALLEEREIHKVGDFAYFKATSQDRSDIYLIDQYLKAQDYMLSAQEREALKKKGSHIVGRKFLITWHKDSICIVPYIQSKVILPKEFKEQMRLLKIDPKLRGYLFENPKVFEQLQEVLF